MTTSQAAAAPTVDVDAITALVTEYYQSWFVGDGERMRRCIHPSLAKRTFEQPGMDSVALHEDPTETLIQDTASGEGTQVTPTQDVTVIDCLPRHGHGDG
jgi:hypothetical protein